MNNNLMRIYKFIVPNDIKKFECDTYGQYDLTMIKDDDGIILSLSDSENDVLNIGDFFEKFTIKYDLLIDFGEYFYLDIKNTILLKEFIEQNDVLHIDSYIRIYELVIQAIELNTGIGLDF